MNAKLKVLHVIPSVAARRGGPSEAVVAMVRALSDRHVSAEIVTTNDDGPRCLDVPLRQWTLFNGARTYFFPRFSPPLSMVREYAFANGFQSWLERNAPDYDAIHVHGLFSYLPTAAMRLARRLHIPYLSRPLGLLGRWPLAQSSTRKWLYLTLAERRNLREAAAVHFTSAQELEEASDLPFKLRGQVIVHGTQTSPLIPNAARMLRDHYKLDPCSKIVLFLGRLHAKKGIDLLLEAFLQMHGPNVILLLAGDGELAPALDQIIERQRLQTRVVRTGFVQGEEKALLLQGADVFALLSRHENFGCAVLEALGAGLPVVVSPEVALAPEIAMHNLGRVAPRETSAVAGALTDALRFDSPSERRRRRDFVRHHYSWAANAAALENLYTSVLAQSRRGTKRTWTPLLPAV